MSPLEKFSIAIDGPAGSGKSTLADNLVKGPIFSSFGCLIFTTGILYRGVAHQALLQKKIPNTPEFDLFVTQAMREIDFFKLKERDLFSPEINRLVPHMPAVSAARQEFFKNVVDITEKSPEPIVILLGRDIGTTAYPQAQFKFFLQTDPDICAARRALEISGQGGSYDEAYRDLLERNRKDACSMKKEFGPAQDATIIQTDFMVPDEVCNQVIETIQPHFVRWITKPVLE